MGCAALLRHGCRPVRLLLNWRRQLFASPVKPTNTKGHGGRNNRFNSAVQIRPVTAVSEKVVSLLGMLTQSRHMSLRKLSVEGCTQIPPKELKAVPQLQSLVELNLNGAQLLHNADSAKPIAALLAQGSCMLQTLELANCLLGHRSMQVLAPALQKNSSVTLLRLQQNPLGDLSAGLLSNIVESTTTLARMPLGPFGDSVAARGDRWSRLNFTDQAYRGLLTALASNPELPTDFLEAPAEYRLIDAIKPAPLQSTRRMAPNPQDFSAANSWENTVLHFGKNRGTRLGDLSNASLNW